MTRNSYAKIYASTIAPDPALDVLWMDLAEDPKGSVIKFWSGESYWPISLGNAGELSNVLASISAEIAQARSEAIQASEDYTDSQIALINLNGYMTVTADNSNAGTFTFDTTVLPAGLTAGKLRWNKDEGTLDLGMNGGNVMQSLGLELYYHVKADSDMSDGDLVMAYGTEGNSGKIVAKKASPGIDPKYIIGIATENISQGNNGFVTWFGKIRGIQTNGASVSEIWVNGDLLYQHPSIAGKLTRVMPAAPKNKMPIAIVVSAHNTNGTVFVRVQRSMSLNDINDVNVSAITTGQVLSATVTGGIPVWGNKSLTVDDIPETVNKKYFTPTMQADIDSRVSYGLITSRNQFLSLLGSHKYGSYIFKFVSPETLELKDSAGTVYSISTHKVLVEYTGSTVGDVIKVYVENATSGSFSGPLSGLYTGANYIGNTTQLILSPIDIYGDAKDIVASIAALESEIISALYSPNGLLKVAYTDNAGNLHIDGDIYQNGSAYETHVEDIYTKNDILTLRDGATVGLAAGEYAGLIAKLYDGSIDGALIFDKDGIARVGDVIYDKDTNTWVHVDAQPLLTREETPVDKSLLYWDADSSRSTTITGTKAIPEATDKLTISDTSDSHTPKTITWHDTIEAIKEVVDAEDLIYISDDDISVLMAIGSLAVVSESTTGYPSVTINVETL